MRAVPPLPAVSSPRIARIVPSRSTGAGVPAQPREATMKNISVFPHEPTNPKLHEAWVRATLAAWAVRNGYKSVTAERATELLQAYQALAARSSAAAMSDAVR